MIWAWMVTSSAVVGSSAMISSGSPASAMAMTTRCFMPPDIWCGYWPCTVAASGMRSWVSSSMLRARASAAVKPRCRILIWSICAPTRWIGSSEVMGFWVMSAMRRPRSAR